ncbi:MAG TPA: FAD-dependent oxidoreductase [Syntrophobacteraceae bacterium]|nr:FAD-dependent oxidoreductase [Syntrophobacteraceae bacterium]
MKREEEAPVGSVLVVGGGVAGIQASLDLANSGFFVTLVEKSPAIGGVMAQLDKTFPTNDCSMCILSPKLVECGRHPNIRLLTLADLVDLDGGVGRFTATVRRRPRYVNLDKCIACGVCAEKCPRKVPDEFNERLGNRKAAFVKYPQAVPLKYAVDREHCIYFEKGKCRACEKFCPAGAVELQQEEIREKIEVGSVILAPGFQAFSPTRYEYGYGRHPDVVTSIEFERILSASGPFQGHLRRPSDGKVPRKIAWLQCVGSRDLQHGAHGYCSGVCCMYAVKEAVVAKEHASDPLDAAVFFMDMRTYGKDFEKYFLRARDEYGVRFVRSRVHTVDPSPTGDCLLIGYVDEGGAVFEEEFDMVVTSVGLEIGKDTEDLARRIGVELDETRFVFPREFAPVATSRKGVYACGAFQGPKDIPASVMEASAAACAAAMDLAASRGSRVEVPPAVPEEDLAGEEPRIGVFVCNCGINIGSVVDVNEVTAYAAGLPHVAATCQNLFTCSQDTQERIKEVIRDKKLNRMVVAACSPRTHEPLFQETLRACGVNKYLFEMANIRDQDSWVHPADPRKATDKAKDLVRMAVARASLLQPLEERPLSIKRRGLVIGGGVAGLNAALCLARQGFEVVLIEREKTLGGMARQIAQTIEGWDVQEYLDHLVAEVQHHEKIQVLTETLVVGFGGYKGNFTTEVLVGPGPYERKIEHGVTIVATGALEYRPREFLYGDHPRVMTQLELGRQLRNNPLEIGRWENLVMIQCVGSRNEEHPNCSRVCCQSAVKHALHLADLNPDMQITILYRDVRTYGLLEEYYKSARGKGILFVRFDADRPPRVTGDGEGLCVTFRDHVLDRPIRMKTDAVVLSAGMIAPDTEELASFLKVPRNADGYFIEAHAKLRPVDFASEGIYLCGTAHGPKLIQEAIAQAMAAAARAASFLASSHMTYGGVVARVQPELCAACLVCVRRCPFGIPRINEHGVSEINEALCQGCGVCVSECPAKAIHLSHYEDDQIMVKVDALFETPERDYESV